MKILVTGAAGFIGFNLASQLAKENYNVIIWDNLSRGKYDTYLKNLLRKKNVKFIKKDLTKKINAKKMNVSHIFHLAGSVGVSNVNKNPYNSFLNNFLTETQDSLHYFRLKSYLYCQVIFDQTCSYL